jgi:hypothetical protein
MNAAACKFDEQEHVEAAQRERLDGEKSQASMLVACWRRNCRQLGPERLGAGARAGGKQDPPDRAGRDTHANLE